MNLLKALCFLGFCLLASPAFPQGVTSTKNKKAIEMYTEADNYRVHFQYQQAIDLFNQAIAKDKNFFEAYLRAGVCYKAMNNFVKANEYFENGLRVTPELRWQKVFWLELVENAMQRGDYRAANGYAEQYLQNEMLNKQRVDQVKLWKACAEFSLQNIRNEIKFNPHKLSDTVNAFTQQYFPVLTADEQQLFFTRRLGVSDEYDEDMVVTTKDKNGRWSTPQSISPKINTRYNEGTCTISGDGRQLIFTSCVGMNGRCDLFESRKTGDEWSVPKNLGPQINSPAWESQPSLSADGRVLYFVSDRRGGIGRADIYVSVQHSPGVWTKAVNLGPNINTPYDERSPFIHANGRTLFFATNGRVGFGGYDIFWSDWADSTWSKPANFGYPINNHEEQYSLVITADGERGYYSHEELSSQTDSKIYEFTIPEEYRVKYRSNAVKGIVRDRATKKPLQAQVELYELAKNELVSYVSSDSLTGNYLIVLTQGADYGLYVNSPGYLFKSLNFNYEVGANLEPLVIDVDLDKASTGATVVLNNIFFDTDKFDLREKSITELDKISRFLKENPNIKVEISGHTDDQGAAAYNQQLSQKRAKAVADYLVSKGVDIKRLKEVGYGSKRPLQPNDSDANRQINRRIEFRITE
ncbi:MAG TPA: OmpA family protein [Cyclobacteriaceae bacterium]|nr:OmpA family protein [Cyclobacteriaceae bacterium]